MFKWACRGQKEPAHMKAFNKKFKDTIIDIDNSEFIECTFNNCLIRYSGAGMVTMVGCNFNECRWEMTGASGATVQFLKSLYSDGEGNIKKLVLDLIYQITNGELGTKLEPVEKEQVSKNGK